MKIYRAAAPSVWSLLTIIALTVSVHAENGDVTFEDILTQGLAKSPLVREVDAELSIRLAEALETRLRLNPQIGAGVGLPADPAGDADKTQMFLTLSQPLRPSDFGTRQVVSELLSKSANVEQRLSILELTQSIYLSYSKLWILQEQRRFLLEQRDRTRRISEKVNKAAAQGALGKGEGGLFEAEYKKLSAQILGVEADTARERATLLRLSTFSTAGRSFQSPEKALKVTKDSLLGGLSDGALPIQARYELLSKVASERERLARRDAFPAVSPQLGYQRTEDGGSFINIGVQLDLPIFNRNEPEILRRQGEANAARAQSSYARSDAFREEITLSLQSLDALQKQAETFENDVVPTLFRALRGYDEQFTAGTGNILSVWQAQRELSNAKLEALQLWTRFFSARSDLSILTGQQL